VSGVLGETVRLLATDLYLFTLLVLTVWGSVIGTLIVPRPVGSRLTRWVDRFVSGAFSLVTTAIADFRRRDRVLVRQAAAILLMQLAAWLGVAFLGYGLLLWPLVPGGLGAAFIVAGHTRSRYFPPESGGLFFNSDLPAGVVNIVTGGRDSLSKTLAEHDDVDALWVFGSKEASLAAERLSAGNLKRTLVDHGLATDWYDAASAEGPIFLRHAVQVKNIWVPYGE